MQWSPVLETLAENMPSRMIMSGLRAESTSERRQVTSEKNPARMVNVNITKRTLVLDITSNESLDYGKEVQNYANRLKSSPVLGPRLESIEVSQKPGTAKDLNTVSYTMNLIFKSGSV
jgi:hypothetical protein